MIKREQHSLLKIYRARLVICDAYMKLTIARLLIG